MRAVIIAAGPSQMDGGPGRRGPGVLLPAGDRPLIQHVVEALAGRLVLKMDFVLSDLPEACEHLLGDGERWGGEFTFHLARDASIPYLSLKRMSLAADELIVLAHADRLPDLAEVDLDAEALYVCPGLPGEGTSWTGWAVLEAGLLADLPGEADERELHAYLEKQGLPTRVVEKCLDGRSYEALLASQRKVLAGEFDVMLTGSSAKRNVRVCRNVALHPTARLIPPVFIGENCRIGPGATIGPNVSVSHDCLIDQRCAISDALILPGGYVGEALTVDHAVVDRNRLISVATGESISVTDGFILDRLAGPQPLRRVAALAGRAAALAALLVLAPVLLVMAAVGKITRGQAIYSRLVVRMPADADEHLWRTFKLYTFCPAEIDGPACKCGAAGWVLRHLLPGLASVAAGHAAVVGVRGRSVAQLRAMPPDWRQICSSAKVGLVTEAMVVHGPDVTDDELYSAEAAYCVRAGAGHNLRLLWGWFVKLSQGRHRGE